MTARGSTRGGPVPSRAHAPGGGHWRNSIPPEAPYPDAAAAPLKRSKLAQTIFDIGAVIFAALFVLISSAAGPLAVFILLFVRVP